MTGWQTDYREDGRRKQRAFGLVVFVCLVLLALLAVVEVAHTHPVGQDVDHCPLCIAMQTAAPVMVAASIVVLVRVWTAAPVFEAHAVVRYWSPKLFTRPPPAGC